MIALLLTILITCAAVTLFGYVVHWSLHQDWAGKFNKSHMTHHTLYPPEDYTSEKYRHAGKDTTVITFAIAAIPMVAAPILLGFFGFLSWPLVVTVVVVELGMGWLHDYIHNSFHIQNHWLSRIPFVKDIFAKWGKLHYNHHVDMGKNYGIFFFKWDKLFKTYLD